MRRQLQVQGGTAAPGRTELQESILFLKLKKKQNNKETCMGEMIGLLTFSHRTWRWNSNLTYDL